jgi:hypothetical protein
MRRVCGLDESEKHMKSLAHYLLGAAIALCGLQFALKEAPRAAVSAAQAPTEMLREFEGQALRPTAPDALERRFALMGKAQVQQYASRDATLLVRTVHSVSRSLHPAADCYRAIGYSLSEIKLRQRKDATWLCFVASKNGSREQICERVESLADGSSFTDTSSWFWAAALGKSKGPWRAITVREAA